jgi:hypothetical protein
MRDPGAGCSVISPEAGDYRLGIVPLPARYGAALGNGEEVKQLNNDREAALALRYPQIIFSYLNKINEIIPMVIIKFRKTYAAGRKYFSILILIGVCFPAPVLCLVLLASTRAAIFSALRNSPSAQTVLA